MAAPLTDDPEARSRSNLIGLGIHAAVFLVVGAGMITLNLLTTPGLPWFTWSLAGWGLGLAMHAVGVLRYETLTEEAQREVLAREAQHRSRPHAALAQPVDGRDDAPGFHDAAGTRTRRSRRSTG